MYKEINLQSKSTAVLSYLYTGALQPYEASLFPYPYDHRSFRSVAELQ